MKTLQPIKFILLNGGSRSMASMSSCQLAIHLQHQIEPIPSPAERRKQTFLHKDLQIERSEIWQMQDKPKETDELKFGHHFADHMMEVDWSEDKGWTRPQITPLKELQLHPGAKVLHYAIELFEGMKAYRGIDNRIRLFRPEMNIARMRRTAARSSLPDFDANELLKIICELVRIDKDWVPHSTTSSLYIRPTMIGTDPTLGVAHSKNAKLFVLSGPVGAFYQTGFKPVSLFADSTFVRAFHGGVGSFKMGCNYAATIMVGRLAAEYGCQQVLWLCGPDQKLTEVGSMNIFVYWINENGEHELVTPPLDDGLILAGITRDSVLAIAQEFGDFKISERYPTMEEMRVAAAEGRLLQMFGSGTACALSPIDKIVHRDQEDGRVEEIQIPTMSSGADLMQRIQETISDIQYGRVDKPEWVHIVEMECIDEINNQINKFGHILLIILCIHV